MIAEQVKSQKKSCEHICCPFVNSVFLSCLNRRGGGGGRSPFGSRTEPETLKPINLLAERYGSTLAGVKIRLL